MQLRLIFLALLLCIILPWKASAVTIYIGDGASSGASVTDLGTPDSANGGDITYLLGTGTYTNNTGSSIDVTLTEVNFWAEVSGTVTPVVALYNGGAVGTAGSYSIVAEGDAIAATAGQPNNADFEVGGAQTTVTVGDGETLIAGFHQTSGIVPFGGGGTSDFLQSNNVIPSALPNPPSADAQWSNLGRTYSFNIGLEESTDPLPPTDIQLSNDELLPGATSGALVGLLNTSDPNSADNIFTYTLVSGAGSTNNALFDIAGLRLETGAALGGVGSSYSIRVRSTDPGGLWFEKTFTITVVAGAAPTAIDLSSAVIAIDAPAGGSVGDFSTSDADPSDVHSYSLVAGAGDDDNAAFTLNGAELRLAGAPPVAGTSYSIRVRSTDLGNLFVEEVFTILVIDPSVRISEVMASNSTSLLDENGDSSDWIEICNEQGEEVNMAGWYLTDDISDLTKWQFPSRVVAGNSYLVVFASNKDRAGANDPELHTNFKLSSGGEFLALVKPDGQTLASVFSPTYPAQTTDISYGSSQDGSTTGYFATPTPGAANGTPSPSGVNAAEFSVGRGFYDAAFTVALTPSIAGSTIRYTTNGTKPTTTSGTVYSAPIPISATTTLRAISYDPGGGGPASLVSTHTYIFVADVITQGNMSTSVTQHPTWGPQMEDSLLDIPTVSLVKSGSISQSESETSMEMIFPDGATGFQIDCGVEHFGGHSLGSPKKNMRMSFKKAYGASRLNYDLFGGGAVKDFDQVILRTGSHDNWFWTHPSGNGGTYVRGRWCFDRQLEAGNVAPRGHWVHVYINGLYHGLHHLMERPNAAFMASYLGGEKEEYEALNAGSPIDGDKSTWNAMKAVLGDYEQLKNFMDVKNYADYMLLQFYGGNDWDWRASQNWASASRKMPGASYKFFAWDSDVILRTTLNANVINSGGPENLWNTVKTHDEFKLLLADRAQKFFFNDGMFTRDRVMAQIDALAARVELPVIAETARWGSNWTPATWQGHVNSMKNNLIDQRTGVVIAQMRAAGVFPNFDAPQFSQFGGDVPANFQLSLSLAANASGGEIYYTTDGSDPIGDTLPPGSTETVLLDQGVAARALIPSVANGGNLLADTWKGGAEPFDDSSWLSGVNGMGYDTGPSYQTLIGLDLMDMYTENASAFARIEFTLTQTQLDAIDQLRLDMKAEDGFVAYLNGVEVASLQSPASPNWDSVALGSTSDGTAMAFQPNDISAHIDELVVGSNILAFHILNQSNGSSDLLCLPRLVGLEFPDGGGGSPGGQLYTGPLTLNESGTIRARVKLGGAWSALDEAFFYVDAETPLPGDLIISEINYNPPEADDAEFVELRNISAKNLTLDGLQFTDGVSFTFSANTVLPPGGHIVVVGNDAVFASRYTDSSSPWLANPVIVAGVFTGSLSNGGENLLLEDSGGTQLLNFSFNDSGSWPGRADGGGSSAELESPGTAPTTQPALDAWLGDGGNWRPSSEYFGSPGRDGSGPDNRVVFNEILAHTDLPSVDQFELYNQTASTVDLSNWFISDDNSEYKKYKIAASTDLVTGGFLTFDEADFNSGTSLIDFALNSASGDDLYLLDADSFGNLLGFVDRAEFGASANAESFGRWPDGTGKFYPMQSQTFGQLNSTGGNHVRVGPVIVSEVMYNPVADPDDGFEFIEVCNAGTSTENLANWRLRGEADFDFASENLGPGSLLVIVGFDPAADTVARNAFLAAYPTASAAQLRGPWSAGSGNRLDNGGAPVRLQRPDALETPAMGAPFYPALFEDTVTYDNTAPWPIGADGSGSSLTRTSATIYGDDATNWQAMSPTPGSHPVTAGTTYDSWAASNGLGAGPAAERLADFEFDGTNNLIEFAIDANPKLSDLEKLPTAIAQSIEVAGETDDYLTITFRKRRDAPQLSYTVEVSGDLTNWLPATNMVGLPVDNGDGTDSITIRDNQPIGDEPRRVIRLRVTEN